MIDIQRMWWTGVTCTSISNGGEDSHESSLAWTMSVLRGKYIMMLGVIAWATWNKEWLQIRSVQTDEYRLTCHILRISRRSYHHHIPIFWLQWVESEIFFCLVWWAPPGWWEKYHIPLSRSPRVCIRRRYCYFWNIIKSSIK